MGVAHRARSHFRHAPVAEREELPTGQMRIALSLFAVNCGRAFALVRSLILIWVFFDPNWSLANQASTLSYGLLALLGIGFALALLPLRFLSPAVRVWIYLEQQRTFINWKGCGESWGT